ncbi:MAG: glucose-6-phosphate isomerase [Proteobacteria bacterium]|nr:glucose-6-phosphate isomerase [Pseudomonadota bacterium]
MNNSWQTLYEMAQTIKNKRLADLFSQDKDRVQKFSLSVDEVYLDYSKNFIDDATMTALVDFAQTCELPQKVKHLFSGESVNNTENRPALHTALRQCSSTSLSVNGENIIASIKSQKEKMFRLVNELHQGIFHGATGKKITDVVNLGIGGSDLGPAMAVEALNDYQQTPIKLHFVSNIDPDAISSVLKECDCATTLFIISSKSFTTPETLENAKVAKEWLQKGLKTQEVVKHFVAVTANPEKAHAFGILPENILCFWEWVGGRYSIWSTIGLPLAIAIGLENYEEFLLGARKMDEHFKEAPIEQNMPVILGLLGWWYIHGWQGTTIAVLPYSERLKRFADYLQQLDMESNGKSVDKQGERLGYATGPIVWGQAGTNGQHAFYQLLHQGTHFIPIDFIVFKHSNSVLAEQHKHLIANAIAQAAALMHGSDTSAKFAHEHMPGNKPSNMLMLEKLTPRALGQLLALYEHKVYVQGVLWDINSFDQPGVELGKKLAKKVVECINHKKAEATMDASTQSLIEKVITSD